MTDRNEMKWQMLSWGSKIIVIKIYKSDKTKWEFSFYIHDMRDGYQVTKSDRIVMSILKQLQEKEMNE